MVGAVLALFETMLLSCILDISMSSEPSGIVEIIDSGIEFIHEHVQNPESMAPDIIIDAVRLVDVEYLGFDQKIHRGQIIVHEIAVDDVLKFFSLAKELAFPIQKVIPIHMSPYFWDDEFSCNDNNTSAFNYRSITARPGVLSNHARGLAFDLNPAQNIYIKYDENQQEVFRYPKGVLYDEHAKGTLTKDHPLVLFMKDLGWEWGGNWTPESGRTDYQHFEKIL